MASKTITTCDICGGEVPEYENVCFLKYSVERTLSVFRDRYRPYLPNSFNKEYMLCEKCGDTLIEWLKANAEEH